VAGRCGLYLLPPPDCCGFFFFFLPLFFVFLSLFSPEPYDVRSLRRLLRNPQRLIQPRPFSPPAARRRRIREQRGSHRFALRTDETKRQTRRQPLVSRPRQKIRFPQRRHRRFPSAHAPGARQGRRSPAGRPCEQSHQIPSWLLQKPLATGISHP